MIRDVTEFSRTGVVCRRVDELDVPVGAWRPAMCHAGRRQGARVRTFLIPPSVVSADEPQNRLVFGVRTAAGRSHRAGSMSRHPSQHGDTDVDRRVDPKR